MVEISRKRLTIDSIWSVVTAIFNALCGIIYLVIIGNCWGSEGLGNFALCVSLYMIGSVIFNLGVHSAVLYEVVASNDDHGRMSGFAYSGLCISFIMGVLGCILGLVGARFLAFAFNQPQITSIIQLFSLAIPLFLINKTGVGILNARRRMRFITSIYFLRSGTILLYLFSMQIFDADFSAIPYGFILAELFCSILLLTACFRAHKFITPTVSKIKKLLSFGWKLALSGIFADINHRLDILVISIFWNPSLVGVYSVATAIAKGMWLIPDAVMKVTNPLIVQLFVSGEQEKLHRTLDILLRFCNSIFMIIGLICAIFIKPLIAIAYPDQPEMSSAAIPLYFLLPSTVIYAGIAAIGSTPAASIGRPGNEMRRILLMLFVNLVMNFILVPVFAVAGAAAATSIAVLSVGVIYFFYLLDKYLNFTVSIKKYSILFILFCLLMVFIAKFENIIPYFALLSTTVTAVIAALIILGMIRKSDMNLIYEIYKSLTIHRN